MGNAAIHTAESLRAALRARFGASVDAQVRARPERGERVPSGWTRVDQRLDGGLAPGQTALVAGDPGAGSLALASAWAAEHVRRREPVLVLDPSATSLAHAWVPPEDAKAPIWRLGVGVAFGTERELWPAFDIALRSGAFGLIVLLEPPRAPRAVAARATKLAREQRARLVVTHCCLGDLGGEARGGAVRSSGGLSSGGLSSGGLSSGGLSSGGLSSGGSARRPTHAGGDRPAPWPPTYRLRLSAGLVQWIEGPLGAAPARRRMEGDVAHVRDAASSFERETDAGARTDRVRAPAHAPDRRPSSGRGGRRRRSR